MDRIAMMVVTAALAASCSAAGRPAPQPESPAVAPAGSPLADAAEHEPSGPALEPVTAPASSVAKEAGRPAFDVSGWDTILRTYATSDGGFRYEALRANADHRALLDTFVRQIGEARPGSWPRDQQLAFYINAYNALVIDSVLDLWPVTSVMQVRGFFNGRTHTVDGNSITLDHLESQIIRSDRFAEPRIHFLVNCASAGCPPLQRQAVTAENLEASLEGAATAFVRRSTRIDRQHNQVRLTQIFEWFGGDFDRVGGTRTFVASHLPEADATLVRNPATSIAFFRYDWSLNARP